MDDGGGVPIGGFCAERFNAVRVAFAVSVGLGPSQVGSGGEAPPDPPDPLLPPLPLEPPCPAEPPLAPEPPAPALPLPPLAPEPPLAPAPPEPPFPEPPLAPEPVELALASEPPPPESSLPHPLCPSAPIRLNPSETARSEALMPRSVLSRGARVSLVAV